MKRKNPLILFQGDSVTDCGRSRENAELLGNGYVGIISEMLKKKYPDLNAAIVNKGVSGNRVCDLVRRWEEDCIDIKPDLLTILIGINDTWRKYDQNDPTSVQAYENDYRSLIKRTRSAFPDIEIIIMEPFSLPYPHQDRIDWREDLDPKIHAARKIAVEEGCFYIPLDGIFAQQAAVKGYEHLLPDGVHPTRAGHMLIAEKWMEFFENYIYSSFADNR